jgi:hypothetical protein
MLHTHSGDQPLMCQLPRTNSNENMTSQQCAQESGGSCTPPGPGHHPRSSAPSLLWRPSRCVAALVHLPCIHLIKATKMVSGGSFPDCICKLHLKEHWGRGCCCLDSTERTMGLGRRHGTPTVRALSWLGNSKRPFSYLGSHWQAVRIWHQYTRSATRPRLT